MRSRPRLVLATIVAISIVVIYRELLDPMKRKSKLVEERNVEIKPVLLPSGTSEVTTENISASGTTTLSVTEQSQKTILLWNPFFNEPDYGAGGFGILPFEISQCSQTCWLTADQSYLETADAVVVHTYNMAPHRRNYTIPQRAHSRQIFVFFLVESPLRSYKGLQETGFSFSDVFNLTFTFLDEPETDIVTPLGQLVPREVPLMTHFKEVLRRKTELVAWFVSHCDAPSSREQYVTELSRVIPVHIYGACGNYTCDLGNRTCIHDVNTKYRFILAFENSYCKDYITEKTWKTLATFMVPVVLGGGNYSKALPAKTVIDVRDFKSPKRLGKYLLYLARNPNKYVEYFFWKYKYEVQNEGQCRAEGFCKLCGILNTPDYLYKSRYDPLPYFNPERQCLWDEREADAVHLSKTSLLS